MRRLVQLGLAAAGAALALGLSRLPGSALPQVVKGEDVLAVAFGDARTVLSQMMIRKSDSYFHGGIDIDCSCKDCRDGEHHHEDHGHEDHDHEDHAAAQSNGGFLDPWRWINAHVRAPQRHVHLDGEKAVELLPFYWAALRADPHNVDGWTTAVFIAARDIGDDAMAGRMIAEAKAANPESAEIAFAEGRLLRRNGQGDLSAARKCFERAKRLLAQKGAENWTEDDQILSRIVNTFLDSEK